ncbi:flagellar export protein FliJ [Rhodanobacter sp. FW510-R12]|uniref:flagellar export protein FliJ n=1 Tax=unclassified Rhodanobacter TaxID=2621553 RepID=UPI0007A9DF89|nr:MULTISPECIES: flagellar export protein FliJ [unclassified Rhodanobacter]KZC16065.1 flagellar export protein FliJ [Rhodanobacter sp. FW104-R8]KZC26636.1 flagellar export protein FliJ [Rhodanobacter sp. FW510-T8]KZC30533.1 flagellar export protein FliJ [Rhodanobacter sp. FW510-R10]
MNSRTKQLEPAVEQARQRSEEALAKLAAQQQQLARAELQLGELQRYRGEYAAAGDAALGVAALLNRRKFVERIDQAITQQTAEVGRQSRQLEQMRERWQQAHARESALDSVVAQHREHERRAEARHEQAEVDERMQHRRLR